jgi:hypothetical protein
VARERAPHRLRVTAERGERAGRAAELRAQRSALRGAQAGARAIELVGPRGGLQAERDRDGGPANAVISQASRFVTSGKSGCPLVENRVRNNQNKGAFSPSVQE